jgi:hypothetical protein
MPRGNPKTVGRPRGVPNKFNTARVERAIAEGRRLPPEELLRNADNCRSMALRYHPMAPRLSPGFEPPPGMVSGYFCCQWLLAGI